MRTVNRLSLVTSAIVSSLLAGSGCTHQKAPASAAPPAHVSAQPTKLPIPTTELTTMPATRAVLTTEPTTVPAVGPSTAPATEPTTQASTRPVFPPAADAPLPDDEKIKESDLTLADRMAGIAELEFATKVSNPDAWQWIWKHQAALLHACGRLAPMDSRFPRLEADAYSQLHDVKGEISALNDAITADQRKMTTPDDFVWNRDLELRLIDMQTAVDKLDYLDSISKAENSVPPDVRAHAGYLKAQIQLQRGEEDSAKATLADALKLCPTSIECLKLRYALLPEDATRFERVTQLLDLLKANPLQAQYSSELADLVANAGLVSESLPWYDLAVGTLHQQGDQAIHEMLNMVAELYIADQLPDAMRLNESLLKLDSGNTSARFLQVLIANGLHNKEAADKAMLRASNVIGNHVIDAVNASGAEIVPRPTTRPVDDDSPLALPDLGAAVAKLNQSDKPELKAQFAESVADLALLEGYFGHQPDAAGKLVDVLKGVVPADSPELARLSGWNDLMNNKPDDAKSKFAPIAERDPLAELGLIEVLRHDGNTGDSEKAQTMGSKLIADYPSGLLGAILWERLHSQRVKLVPSTQAASLQAPLAAFPRKLMELVDRPQGLYSIHVEPADLHVGSYPGEPLLAKVQIDNLGQDDLTVGPDGVIKPELIFRVSPEVGDKPVMFQAFDNISGPMVLSHGSPITQVVRIDQTQLLAYLTQLPPVAFQINGTLTLNETAHRVGGYTVMFAKPFFREAAPPSTENFKTYTEQAAQGRPDQQITALSLLEMYVMQLRSLKDPPADVANNIELLLETIHRVRSDDLPAVAAWASKCEAELVPKQQAESVVRDMLESDDWRHRQLGLMLIGRLDAPVREQILNVTLAKETQTSMQQDIVAVKGMLSLPPSTQPTTEPTTPLVPPVDTSTPLAPPLIPNTPSSP